MRTERAIHLCRRITFWQDIDCKEILDLTDPKPCQRWIPREARRQGSANLTLLSSGLQKEP